MILKNLKIILIPGSNAWNYIPFSEFFNLNNNLLDDDNKEKIINNINNSIYLKKVTQI